MLDAVVGVYVTGVYVILTYCVLIVRANANPALMERAWGGLVGLKGPWAVSALLTIAAYIHIIFTANRETLYAVIIFNVCASLWGPLLILETDTNALIATSLTAAAAVAVVVTMAVTDDPNGLELLSGAWLIVHHLIFDVFLYA